VAYLDNEFKEFLSRGYPKEQGKWSFMPTHRYNNTASPSVCKQNTEKKTCNGTHIYIYIYVAYTIYCCEHERA